MPQTIVPFEFLTASYLVRVRPERARTLGELARGIRTCSEASLFHHTFQSLEPHQRAFFSSDFSQWVADACCEARLADRLASVDIRTCGSIAALRDAVAGPIEAHLRQVPGSDEQPGAEPFYFCEILEVTLPRGEQAMNLSELMTGIRRINQQTLHHHFINSRVRLHLQANDFSHWIDGSLHMQGLAFHLNQLDIQVHTLEDLREEILRTIEPWAD